MLHNIHVVREISAECPITTSFQLTRKEMSRVCQEPEGKFKCFSINPIQ